MNFVDILGGLGSGYSDAVTAGQKAALGYNQVQQSNIDTSRAQDQYNADDDYDIFNATSANNRSKQDLGEGTNDLALMGVQDKMDQFDPNTRAQIGALAQQYGADTPEFRKALGDFQASRGRLADADPQYAKFNQEAQARQQVVAQMQSMPAFQDVQIDSVQKDEYGNLIALVGEPDENGDYEVMDLPPSLTRLYAGLTGNTKPLGMDSKVQQGILASRAAQAGQFPGVRGITQRTQAQEDLNTRAEARNDLEREKLLAKQSADILNEFSKRVKTYTNPNSPKPMTQHDAVQQVYEELINTPGAVDVLKKAQQAEIAKTAATKTTTTTAQQAAQLAVKPTGAGRSQIQPAPALPLDEQADTMNSGQYGQ